MAIKDATLFSVSSSLVFASCKRANGNWNQRQKRKGKNEACRVKIKFAHRGRCCRTIAGIKRNCRAGGSFCLSRHINMELIKIAKLIEFL